MVQGPKIIFGTAPLPGAPVEVQKEFLAILEDFQVKHLDTAFIYPDSEKTLGELDAPSKFIIHTKAPGFQPGASKRDSILDASKKSYEDLKVEQVETYFLHSPDTETPIAETVDTIQELFKSGKFKHFGLSNFRPQQVQEVYDYASSKGYVLPTVFQGNYNPVSRHIEEDLFPLLRKLNISFYAYSPLAGGFLVKSREDIIGAGAGTRWDKDSMIGALYQKLYNKPLLLDALSEWDAIAKDAGISRAALAYRWVSFHSALDAKYGDGVIIGATRPAQLKETLAALEEGPLKLGIVDRIQKVWDSVKDEAPIDNYAAMSG